MKNNPERKCPKCGNVVMPQASYCSACGSRIFVDAQGQDTADPYLGQVIDNTFVVESILGTGSMGIVYKARHRALDCYVALKVLRHDFLRDRVVLARFQREAQAASSLDHPNVIRILHYGKTHLGAPYIAMECLDGDELSVLVPKAFPMQQKRVCRIALQTARALSAAHAANIIHRDLKPANIVVILNDNGEEIVKVLDFGIAKIADVEGEGLTKEGAVCGTPAFMSPEQVLGRTVTPISDLFSLGCVMYFMLTCRLPFQGQTMVDMATAILTTNPTPPSKARIDTYVNPSLERICMKALSKEPEDRYQSALEMVRDLEEVYKNMPDVDPHVRPKIVVGEPDILDDLDGETRCGINVYEMGIDDGDDSSTQLEVRAMDDDMEATAASGVAPIISSAILPPQAKSGYPSRHTASAASSTPTITTKWPREEDDDDEGNAFFTRQVREKNKRLMILAVSIALGVSLLGILVAFIVSRSSEDEQEMIHAELEDIEKTVQAEPVKNSVNIVYAADTVAESAKRGLFLGCGVGLAYADKDDESSEHKADAEDPAPPADAKDAKDESGNADEEIPPVKAEAPKVEQPKVEQPKVDKPKVDKPKKPRSTTTAKPSSSGGNSFTERFMEAGRLERAGEKDRACAIYRSLLKSPGLVQADKLKVQAKLRTCTRLPI